MKLKGRKIAGCEVKPMQALRPFVEKHKTQLAVITTPATVSQHIADRLVDMGIRAIWNFSPTRLIVPDHVFVRDEHISLGYAEISHHLSELNQA